MIDVSESSSSEFDSRISAMWPRLVSWPPLEALRPYSSMQSVGKTRAAWRSASGGLAALWAAGFVAANRRQGFLLDRAKERPIRIALGHMVGATVVVLGFSNALFPSPLSGGRHLLLVGLCLGQSAQLFLLAGFEGTGTLSQPDDDESAE